MFQKFVIYLSLIIFIGGLLLMSYIANSFFSVFDGTGHSSKAELVDNYNNHVTEINILQKYFNSITPKDVEVYIEFESERSINFKVYYITDPKYPRKIFFEAWNINPYTHKPETPNSDTSEGAPETNSLEDVKRKLHWDDNTFRTIKDYLDKANCLSVTNGEPCNIGFTRSEMGMYFYNIFENPISEDAKEQWNDSCQYIFYNNKLVLEYGNGVIGPDCFPDP